MYRSRLLAVAGLATLVAACASPETVPKPVEPPVARSAAAAAQAAALAPQAKVLKRKIAIGRFSNETRYGRTFLRDGDTDPLGKQASDMLANRLVESGSFLVFERPDIDKLKREQAIGGGGDLIGVDTLILGSVTEFGRSTVGQSGFFSATKRQVAHAKVEIRLADPRTGYVFFSATGQGEATSEAADVMGFGSRADYDATLNDKAIGAAVSDVMNGLVTKLTERPWRTDILKVAGDRVFISGGARQGLKVGDSLAVMREGEKVKSAQTGFTITLPASPVAGISVVSLFGTNETDEGAVCAVTSGRLPADARSLFVSEATR
ncbi:CsgG/HfaB family protein [Oleispirillum naphthae]|uniref:CsgG/HfaB family protein n=1 Tax=Oleispirillum naphthae TaxID=2838853 RepID=UPI0030824647